MELEPHGTSDTVLENGPPVSTRRLYMVVMNWPQ